MNTETHLSIKRIQGLTDATFAVAMTILILEVKVPKGLAPDDLKEYLLDAVSTELSIYFVGFLTLGIFWIGSHFHHHLISRTDRISSWLNIGFLMIICIVPFSAGFLNNYRSNPVSVIFYSINLIIASVLNLSMLWYAWKREYIKSHFQARDFKNAIYRMLMPIFLYVAIIPISLFTTRIAIYLFILPVLLHIVPEKGNRAINDQLK